MLQLLISGNKFSTYINSQFSFFTNLVFHVVKLLGVNPIEFKVLWTATGLYTLYLFMNVRISFMFLAQSCSKVVHFA